MLKGDRATPSLMLFSRVQMSWKCKNILCGRECTVPPPDGRTIKTNILFVNVPLELLSPEAFFSPKCTKYHLATGLRPDPLGELTALPRPTSWIWGVYFEGERKGWERRDGTEGSRNGERSGEGGICVIDLRGDGHPCYYHTVSLSFGDRNPQERFHGGGGVVLVLLGRQFNSYSFISKQKLTKRSFAIVVKEPLKLLSCVCKPGSRLSSSGQTY